MIRTGICKHCGKPEKAHAHLTDALRGNAYCDATGRMFVDGGILPEHAEELYEAAVKLIEIHNATISYVQYDPEFNQTVIETTGEDALKLEAMKTKEQEYEQKENILLSLEVKYWDWLRMKGTTPGAYAAIIEAMDLYAASVTEDLRKDKHFLSELLATIHGDGGHYEDKHGTQKATQDAMDVYWAYRLKAEGEEKILNEDVENLKSQIVVSESENAALRELVGRALPLIKETNPAVYDHKGIAEKGQLLSDIEKITKKLVYGS